jgi:hypothetical protein
MSSRRDFSAGSSRIGEQSREFDIPAGKNQRLPHGKKPKIIGFRRPGQTNRLSGAGGVARLGGRFGDSGKSVFAAPPGKLPASLSR